MNAPWFLILVFGFTFGVGFRSFVDLGDSFTVFLVILAALLLAVFYMRREKAVFFVSLAILSCALGISRFDLSQNNQGDALLDAREGKEVTLLGIVDEEPDERVGRTNLIVRTTELREQDTAYPVTTRIRVTVDRYPEFKYGDELEIRGKLFLPRNFENEETGRVFDYRSYLAKDGIFYQLLYPTVSFLGEGKGGAVKGSLLALKRKFLDNISAVIAEPESSLLGGLLVGAKQSLGEELLDDFRTAGVIHIVVLSGYNLTIVAEAIMRFFSFAPRLWGLSLGGLGIVLFAIMTGAGATVVRASLMALLALLARATGRVYEITLALLLAGFVMLLYNPKILVFDPSFQLSFIATLGLIHIAPLLEKFFSWAPRALGIREIISATLATQVAVLPLLLFMTGTFSLVALPANLLILPLIPLTMLFGFLAGVFGFVGVIFSLPFAFIAHMLLWYELLVVSYAVDIPFSSFQGITISATFMVVLYGLIMLGIWMRKRSSKNER